MKSFCFALISAVALASGSNEDLDKIVSVTTSEKKVVNTIPMTEGTTIAQSVTWYTEVITEKTENSDKETVMENTNSLVMSISTGMAPSVFEEGDIVMSYASFNDPDAPGNFSSFECLITYTAVVENATYSRIRDVALWNHYGTGLRAEEGEENYFDPASAAQSKGPWVLPGDGTDADIDWKNAMKLESDPNTTVTCQATRMIGPIPASVYGDSSLRFTWGEIPGFIDIKSRVNYNVETGYTIYRNGAMSSFADGTPFTVAWVDSHPKAIGLALSAAAASLMLAGFF